MTQIAVKDFEIKESYFSLIQKRLIEYLRKMLYQPVFDIADVWLKAINTMSEDESIINALKAGVIYYDERGFSAKRKFSNKIASILEKWGAIYDRYKKIYKIPREKIPESIFTAITEAQIEYQERVKAIQEFLNNYEQNIDKHIEKMIFNDEVETILDDAGQELKKNVKKINVIEVELNNKQKEEIARTYTNNLQLYIKDFELERIPKMRKQIQKMTLQGLRPNAISEMLQKEYGIAQKKAKFLAQQETSIVLSQIKKAQYQEMGSIGFIWQTITDGKERPEHKALNGTFWTWSELPIIDERTGERGLPGQAYGCRCGMRPVFKDNPFTKAKNSSDDIKWITMKGNHILVKKGQSIKQAIKQFLEKFKEDKEDNKDNNSPKIAGTSKGKPMNFKEANEGKVNPNYGKSEAYSNNCQTCIAVFEARLRGYDIEACSYDETNRTMYMLAQNPTIAYLDLTTGTNPDFIETKAKNPKECEKWLRNKIKPGERYAFGYLPKGNNVHHIVIVNKNIFGKLKFYDPQNGKTLGAEYLKQSEYDFNWQGLRIPQAPKIFRLDNLKINFDVLESVSKKKD